MAEPKSRQPQADESQAKKGKPGAGRPAAGKPAAATRPTGTGRLSKAGEPRKTGRLSPLGAGAEAESRSTAEILAASSEEFRDSLQTIRGALELLLAGKVPDQDKAAQFLAIAYRETGYLSHRVSDLHIASLIETERLRVKLTTLDLASMLAHVVQELSPVADDQEIEIDLQADAGLPSLQGDESLLRLTLTNMLEITLKSTPRKARLLIRAGSQAERIVVRVEREGRGAESEADRLIAHVTEGQSLALYVAQRIALAHDGGLEVDSGESGIQLVILTLPRQPSAPLRGRILVVDDNPQAAFLLEYALQEEGYDPVKAMNGPDALKLASEGHFDLIILDVLLPGIDGFEVCHRLRADPATASVPVIMVSAKAREEDQATALRIGADAYFGKPLSMASLMSAISDLLEAGHAG